MQTRKNKIDNIVVIAFPTVINIAKEIKVTLQDIIIETMVGGKIVY